MYFLAVLISIGICYFMGRLIYEHYTAPFKQLKAAKEIKRRAAIIKERLEIIENDKEFKKRIAPVIKALSKEKITEERYETIFMELLKERNRELFNDDIFDLKD